MASDPIMYSLSTSNATAGQSGHSMALRHHTTQVVSSISLINFMRWFNFLQHVDSDLPAGVPIASLPYGGSVLWSAPWTPPTQRRSTFYDFNRTTTFYAESKKAYLQSNPEEVDTPPLHLIAPDLQSLVHLFIAEVCAANFASDFTLLLAPNRHFMM